MSQIKPNNFPSASTPLTGVEELYSQTGGVNSKFLVSDIWASVPKKDYSITPILTGRLWIDTKPEYEVVIKQTSFSTGSNLTHNLGIDTYISIEGYSWKESAPESKIALIRNSSNGSLTKGNFDTIDNSKISNINLTDGHDTVLFILKYTLK